MVDSNYLHLYGAAVFGSLMVELSALLREVGLLEGRLPTRYRSALYVSVRVAFAFLGAGPLALILQASSLLNAFTIGIGAPLILDRLVAGLASPPIAESGKLRNSDSGEEGDDDTNGAIPPSKH